MLKIIEHSMRLKQETRNTDAHGFSLIFETCNSGYWPALLTVQSKQYLDNGLNVDIFRGITAG